MSRPKDNQIRTKLHGAPTGGSGSDGAIVFSHYKGQDRLYKKIGSKWKFVELDSVDTSRRTVYADIKKKPKTFPPVIGTGATDALAGNTTTISGAESTKLGHLTITGATDLDTMRTHVSNNNAKPVIGPGATDAMAGNTTTISGAQAIKLGHLTVTGATNLDTMRSDVSGNNAKPVIGSGSGDAMAGDTSIPVDLTVDGAGTVHANNYTDTTYTVGDGGLTQKNFTTTLKTKVDYLTVTGAIDLDTMESDVAANTAKEANATDATLLARANHTGTQAMATISDAGDFATKNIAETYGDLSLRFDGVDDYVEIADTPHLSFGDGTNDFPFSISAWINIADASDFTIISKGTMWTGGEWWFATTGSDYLELAVLDQSANKYQDVFTAAITAYEGKWIHVAATYDGTGGNTADTGMAIYINGVSQSVTAGGNETYTAMESGTAVVHIGRKQGTSYGAGSISDVKVYNLELSATEVKELYSGASVPFKYKGANQTQLAGAMAGQTARWNNNGLETFSYSGNDLTAAAETGSFGATFNGDGTYPLTPGKIYRIEYTLDLVSGTAPFIRANASTTLTTGTAMGLADDIVASDGFNSHDFTARGSPYIGFRCDAESSFEVTDWKVYRVGAVAEYEPDGIDIANTTWHDSSGNDLDGTINGATIVGQTKLNEYSFGSNQDSTSTILAGNLTGTIDGEAVATVKAGAAAGATANQDSTATILAGNLTGSVDGTAVATIKSGAAAGATANQDSTSTILAGNHTGTIALTATVDSVAMSAIKAGAALGDTASQDSRGYLNFGDGTSTAYNSVSPQPFDVEMHTLNGVLNGDGYAMPRAGRVTGMSVYCDNTISGTDSSVTFYVTDNGSKTASYVMFEKNSDFKVGEDLAYADDFSHAFSAGDRIGCIMTIDDAGGGAIGKIAISIEVVT